MMLCAKFNWHLSSGSGEADLKYDDNRKITVREITWTSCEVEKFGPR